MFFLILYLPHVPQLLCQSIILKVRCPKIACSYSRGRVDVSNIKPDRQRETRSFWYLIKILQLSLDSYENECSLTHDFFFANTVTMNIVWYTVVDSAIWIPPSNAEPGGNGYSLGNRFSTPIHNMSWDHESYDVTHLLIMLERKWMKFKFKSNFTYC